MAWRSAGSSSSRSLASTARISTLRSARPQVLPRLRPPPSTSSPRRRFSFGPSRNLGELGCAQSLLPLSGAACLSSYLAVNARACPELSHGTFCRTCQDR
ncbi:LOW QUALITY PROTEIN: uncharacterized protein [Rutidosis leptorrhynchoides]|uniref:LOW QUALITY PROTEIN: uncharacterized protein n=1 Tax=Rutidosis leptorrhynchoides TaxID=125765 RepID=UPI003A99F3D7